MKRARIGALVLFCLAPAQVAAQAECNAQDHRSHDWPGAIVVTEYAFAYRYSNCPRSRLPAEDPITIGLNTILFIWFRLQGDLPYLDFPDASKTLEVAFYRRLNNTLVYQRSLWMGTLDLSAVRAEANDYSGVFDWRTYVEKWSFDVPGQYVLRISQGNARICFTDSSREDCGLEFTVE